MLSPHHCHAEHAITAAAFYHDIALHECYSNEALRADSSGTARPVSPCRHAATTARTAPDAPRVRWMPHYLTGIERRFELLIATITHTI